MSISNPCRSQIWVCTPDSQSSQIKTPTYNHPVIMCLNANRRTDYASQCRALSPEFFPQMFILGSAIISTETNSKFGYF